MELTDHTPERFDRVLVVPLFTAKQCSEFTAAALTPHGWAPAHEKVRTLVEKHFGRLCAGVPHRYVLSEVELIRQDAGHFELPHAHETYGGPYSGSFSIMCNLNGEFVGGELYFPGLRFAFRGAPGHAVMFPSTYRHCVQKIESGTRLALQFFLRAVTAEAVNLN